ncbi:GNAT family N-acetyltransferase [Pelagimonas varians]|uniref:Ribosomal N-acetyltransferase YdaF n=1 Tax=Pelagimonas varians TaxID=696760 RepID=A0A238KAF3_9RHOB|nr:GNAT family protein [Pelagimonas varians]PYG31188.1 RimJ/RimL family protein N-acetyltransferase [Pelagimonas varians]SMX39813.1 Putative ribosomal N-acetyltransferase YdaF [Pelagimonas varians]
MRLVDANSNGGNNLQRGSIVLRQPRAGDAEARFNLGQDPTIIRMFGKDPTALPPWTRESASAWVAEIQHHPSAWIIEYEGALAGSIRLNNVNLLDKKARLGIGLAHHEQLGQGIGRGAISLLLDHAFGPMGLHRVHLRVIEYNTRAIRCYEACGFRREGIERESARVGTEWHDDILMAKLAQDHR